MLESGRTPFLAPAELEQLGFRLVIYGISLLMHAVQAVQRVLTGLAHGKIDFAGKGVGFEEYKSMWASSIGPRLKGNINRPPGRLADSKQIQTQSVASPVAADDMPLHATLSNPRWLGRCASVLDDLGQARDISLAGNAEA
jgi:hypothetical protein